MDFFHALATYGFLQRAAVAAVLTGIVCGIVGTYMVARRMVFLGGGITHASFGGIGIAYYLGLNPLLGALVFAVLSALGIEWGTARGRIREDSAIGMVWSFGMAVGIIFIYLTPGYAPNLMGFLFGNILTVTAADLWALGGLVAVTAAVALLAYRSVMYVAFDRAFARSRGVPVMAVSCAMAVLVALSIVCCIRSVGIVLLIALLTVPAAIVNGLTRSFSRITLWSSVVAVVGNCFGLWLSYRFDIPAGAATIFLLALTLIVIKLLPLCGPKRAPRSEDDR
ncbi:MAG TPA: metal ABC transporter permease [Candidatus Tidjanibacter faecipullorum]|uniref:Metal ABC transporter permease n=1 Tax=Candidatus Tidjanibacter faecipullorum TaxID=2838766 RepID=A0A9D2ILY4_9BACT|nr:metal ABC transporter permease [Candidatus Tidjanibacter faecipullorum]